MQAPWACTATFLASADKYHLGHITKQGSTLLRFALGQAASHAARMDADLKRTYFTLMCIGAGAPKPKSRSLGSFSCGCSSCCATRSTTTSSAGAGAECLLFGSTSRRLRTD